MKQNETEKYCVRPFFYLNDFIYYYLCVDVFEANSIVRHAFLVADNESSAAIMNETACWPLAQAEEKHISERRADGGKRPVIRRNRAH